MRTNFLSTLRLGSILGAFALLGTLTGADAAVAQYDPNPAWPLCGNYYQTVTNPTECPSSRWGMPDLINDTFGPRLRDGGYDWHRGIDLHTHDADDRPVFAITCGKIRTVDSSYNGEVLIEHYPNHTCGENDTLADLPRCHRVGGCYYSRYKHLSSTVVFDETYIAKGELLGYTARNIDSTTDPDWADAYPHLHFEIRDYPGGPDYYARGQREAIHPLQVLPYDDDSADDITVSITDVDTTTDPSHTIVTVEVSMPNDTEELDLVRVDVALYENGVELVSANPGASYSTPDGDAYEIDPPFFDMELWSRQFNYTDTSKVPYEEFLPASVSGEATDGDWMPPFADPTNSTYYMSSFPSSYDADFHLEARKSSPDEHVGEFNGLEVEPANFNRTYSTYDLTLRFERLPAAADPSQLCVKAWATDALNNATSPDDATSGAC